MKTYQNFPFKIVLLANFLSIATYLIGFFTLNQANSWLAGAYLVYCLAMEVNVMRRSCVHCYYYGKVCGLGKGKLCSKFFKRGKAEKFGKEGVGLLKLIPDFLVFIIPLVTGVILLIKSFNWVLLVAMIILILIASIGNAIVRGNYVCKYCHQRLLSCPAEKFFNRKKG